MNNNLGDWLRKDIWDVRAAAALLLGFIPRQEGNGAITANLPPYRPTGPRSRGWHAEMQAICLLANEAIDASVLPHLDKRKERRVAPATFARWARAKGYEIPHAWQTTLLSAQDAPQPTDSPPPPVAETPSPEVADESAADEQDKPNTGRQDYLAIELDQILRR